MLVHWNKLKSQHRRIPSALHALISASPEIKTCGWKLSSFSSTRGTNSFSGVTNHRAVSLSAEVAEGAAGSLTIEPLSAGAAHQSVTRNRRHAASRDRPRRRVTIVAGREAPRLSPRCVMTATVAPFRATAPELVDLVAARRRCDVVWGRVAAVRRLLYRWAREAATTVRRCGGGSAAGVVPPSSPQPNSTLAHTVRRPLCPPSPV